MAFTMPSTYKGKGTVGYGATFGVDPAAGSPPSIVVFVNIKSFEIDYGDRPKVTITHLLSPNFTEELVPGPTMPGTITFSGDSIGDVTQLELDTLQALLTSVPFQIVGSMQQGAKTVTITGFGYLESHKEGPFEIGKPVEISGKFQMTGPYVKTVA